ncbi:MULTISPECIES: hypothetical protein [Paeniglutamicibacter]|uniref:hypothetical protein n=1 Tax=Paeniglutamicibacter TaxID=1742990 RepID=UPI0021F6A403|nr:hypothetical protein [Paeniglutamicibacter sp. ZC-3]MCV9995501.1 hypothetical protein [Paeniglutamicibacter sp. ZC-3]
MGTEFTQCFGKLTGSVSGQTNCFTNNGNAAATTGSCDGVLIRQLRIDIDQATGHDQVLGYPFVVDVVKVTQFRAGNAVQFLAGYIVINFR